MQQFDLSVWLQDKSRKVVTRDGRPVRILDYNVKGDKHICIAVDDEIQESITTVDEDGHCLRDKTGWHESNFDLFFADEKEQDEFENTMFSFAHAMFDHLLGVTKEVDIKEWKEKFLNLARKELEKEIGDKCWEAHLKGEEEALKDLPKWKKMPNGIQGNGDFNPTYLVRVSNGYHFTTPCLSWDKDSMYIELSELEKLPKEE